ncbi:Crinkler (CRN) family protein [Phytophthora nicotianae]|uniref:Crinkler (CRN) family protein n=1 Tax=Phytophthora nicotianae TaxID=4792 RepID=A0A0W8BW72_PHYNI|nr:Crinkler (CRN) family protein [Phytophthora nicotianae]
MDGFGQTVFTLSSFQILLSRERLVCAIVGEKSVLTIKISDTKMVDTLKDATKEKKKCGACELKLFLAVAGGEWLLEKGPAAQALKNGVIHPDVKKIIDENKMMASWTIEDVLNESETTGKRAPIPKQVQVLVMLLGDVRKAKWRRLNTNYKSWIQSINNTQVTARPATCDELSEYLKHELAVSIPLNDRLFVMVTMLRDSTGELVGIISKLFEPVSSGVGLHDITASVVSPPIEPL